MKKIVWKILVVFIIPFLLASPWPPPPFHIKLIGKDLFLSKEIDKEEKYKIPTNIEALGSPWLTNILGIKMDSLRGFVCMKNISKIENSEGGKVSPTELLQVENNGSISVKLFADGSIQDIKIPFLEKKCIYPKTVGDLAELSNKVSVQGFTNYKTPKIINTNGQTFLVVEPYPSSITTTFNMETTVGYELGWIYLKNYLLSLIGWIILLSSGIQVWQWLFL